MIIYSYQDPFSSLWWMYGSVLPQVAPLAVLAAFHGVVAVYFKENYNLFVTNTTHTILGPTVGFLLLLKASISYRHYGVAKQVCTHTHSRTPTHTRTAHTLIAAHTVAVVVVHTFRQFRQSKTQTAAFACWHICFIEYMHVQHTHACKMHTLTLTRHTHSDNQRLD